VVLSASADTAQNVRSLRRFDERFYRIYEVISRVYIDASVFVAYHFWPLLKFD